MIQNLPQSVVLNSKQSAKMQETGVIVTNSFQVKPMSPGHIGKGYNTQARTSPVQQRKENPKLRAEVSKSTIIASPQHSSALSKKQRELMQSEIKPQVKIPANFRDLLSGENTRQTAVNKLQTQEKTIKQKIAEQIV